MLVKIVLALYINVTIMAFTFSAYNPEFFCIAHFANEFNLLQTDEHAGFSPRAVKINHHDLSLFITE